MKQKRMAIPVVGNPGKVSALQLLESLEGGMILLLSHLLGQLGEHLQHRQAQRQRLCTP
jgi:hypothetical protein